MQQSGIIKTLQATKTSGHIVEQVVHHRSLC